MLHFAVAGSPRTTPPPGGTVEGLKRAQELGITAMEIEWVQRVPTNAEHMAAIRSTAEQLRLTLTVHAPYYVNLNAENPNTLLQSKKRILSALAMAEIAGVRSVCVHAAFYVGRDPNIALENVRRATDDIMQRKERFFPHVNLAYETMGKPTQFGTMQEVLSISKEFGIYPCIDPAHLHARTNGEWNTTEEWERMFDLYAAALGKESLQNMHLHYSGIAYGPRGEKKHLPLEESDARWEDFLKVLKKRNIGGVLVCESPIQEDDTLLMRTAFERMDNVEKT